METTNQTTMWRVKAIVYNKHVSTYPPGELRAFYIL